MSWKTPGVYCSKQFRLHALFPERVARRQLSLGTHVVVLGLLMRVSPNAMCVLVFIPPWVLRTQVILCSRVWMTG